MRARWSVVKLQNGLGEHALAWDALTMNISWLGRFLDYWDSRSNMLTQSIGRYEGRLAAFAQSGNAMVFELWFGGQLGVSRLAITSSEMVVMLKTTNSEEFARFSPGRLLLCRVVALLTARVFSFLRGLHNRFNPFSTAL